MAKSKNSNLRKTIVAPISLLAKLGSIAVHAEEFLSPHGHEFDKDALRSLLADQEVMSFLSQLDMLSLLPKKRNK